MKPMTLILVGSVIAIAGGLIGAYGTWKHNKSSSEKSTRIEDGVNRGINIGESTNSEVIVLKSQNNNLTIQSEILKEKLETQAILVDKLRNENLELYTKLASASTEIFNNLTGGDSYCYMAISSINPTQNIGYLTFLVNGKYPLNSIQVRIVDLNSLNTEIFTIEKSMENIISIGTLEPDRALTTLNKLKLDPAKGVNLNLFFSANNGFSVQLIRMKFINNEWVSATQVKSITTNKELYREIDPSYPVRNPEDVFK